MDKSKMKYVLVAAMVVVFGFLWYQGPAGSGRQQGDGKASLFDGGPTSQPQLQASSAPGKIYIHIVGAVKKPGVYTFDESPRVIDVVREAGGFTKDAARSGINQAETVEDGSQLVIAAKGDRRAEADAPAEGQAAQRSGDIRKININTATKEELMTLSGIGESKAVSIVSYRETKGKFKKIEDIMNITGIKEGVFDKIRDQISV